MLDIEAMLDVEALIDRWQAGDERAAESLYDHHRNRVFRLAYGLLGDAAGAEEVAQDALTYALLNIERYDPRRGKFTTWLHTITVSRCRDRQRRRRLPALSLTAWLRRGDDRPASEAGLEQQVVRAQTRSQVWEAVQALSRPLREAIVLRHWTAHTYKEMAEIMECPLGTAQSRVRLAYGQLEKALSPNPLMDSGAEGLR